MIGNDEPGCLSVMWQIMSWWLITKSHSASTRGTIVMQTEGGKGISQDFFTQSAGKKWWSCFWLSRCSSCRDKPRYPAAASERSYKKTTSMRSVWNTKTKKQTKKTQASVVDKWCFIEWGDCSFYGLLSPTNFGWSQELLFCDAGY